MSKLATVAKVRRILFMLLMVEIVGCAAGLVWIRGRGQHPNPPRPDMSRLPGSTASELVQLQQRARNDEPNAWRELGLAYLAYGYFVEAEACLRYTTTRDPNDFAAVYGWAYSLDRMGRTSQAHPIFEMASRIADPEMFRTCLYQIARNKLRDEDRVGAERAFELLNKSPMADHQRARLLLTLGKIADASGLVARLEKTNPSELCVQLLAMQLKRAEGDLVAENEYAERAERASSKLQLSDHWTYLHPIRSRLGLHAMLARVEAANHNRQLIEACLHFEKIVQETDPELFLDKLMIGADLELRAGRPDEALRLLQLLDERTAMQPHGMHLMGDALSRLGRVQQAREIWERANRLRPRAETHQQLAILGEKQGDADGAKMEGGLMRIEVAIQAYRQDQVASARELLEQAVKTVPGDARAWFYLGETRRLSQDSEGAAAAFRKCLEVQPNHGRALERLKGQ